MVQDLQVFNARLASNERWERLRPSPLPGLHGLLLQVFDLKLDPTSAISTAMLRAMISKRFGGMT